MNNFNYKNSYAWPEAIALITLVNRLSDDLPETEQDNLARELRRTAIDLATAIAVDLISETSPRIEFTIRLETQLEVIRQVYPALDTLAVEQALEKLFDRLRSGNFNEMRPAIASENHTENEPVSEVLDQDIDESSPSNSEPNTPPTVPPPSTSIQVQSDNPSA